MLFYIFITNNDTEYKTIIFEEDGKLLKDNRIERKVTKMSCFSVYMYLVLKTRCN